MFIPTIFHIFKSYERKSKWEKSSWCAWFMVLFYGTLSHYFHSIFLIVIGYKNTDNSARWKYEKYGQWKSTFYASIVFCVKNKCDFYVAGWVDASGHKNLPLARSLSVCVWVCLQCKCVSVCLSLAHTLIHLLLTALSWLGFCFMPNIVKI